MLTDQKVGVALPKDGGEVRELDRQNSNTLWTDLLQGDVRNPKVAFEMLEVGKRPQGTTRLLKAMQCRMQGWKISEGRRDW